MESSHGKYAQKGVTRQAGKSLYAKPLRKSDEWINGCVKWLLPIILYPGIQNTDLSGSARQESFIFKFKPVWDISVRIQAQPGVNGIFLAVPCFYVGTTTLFACAESIVFASWWPQNREAQGAWISHWDWEGLSCLVGYFVAVCFVLPYLQNGSHESLYSTTLFHFAGMLPLVIITEKVYRY